MGEEFQDVCGDAYSGGWGGPARNPGGERSGDTSRKRLYFGTGDKNGKAIFHKDYKITRLISRPKAQSKDGYFNE